MPFFVSFFWPFLEILFLSIDLARWVLDQILKISRFLLFAYLKADDPWFLLWRQMKFVKSKSKYYYVNKFLVVLLFLWLHLLNFGFVNWWFRTSAKELDRESIWNYPSDHSLIDEDDTVTPIIAKKIPLNFSKFNLKIFSFTGCGGDYIWIDCLRWFACYFLLVIRYSWNCCQIETAWVGVITDMAFFSRFEQGFEDQSKLLEV